MLDPKTQPQRLVFSALSVSLLRMAWDRGVQAAVYSEVSLGS